MQYEIGKAYEMNVIGMRKDSAGYEYIALRDDDPSKEYRVYNILKCQYDSPPPKLYVKVKHVDPFGRIKLIQDEERLVKEHYTIGKLYPFDVISVKEDYNTQKPYYVLEDEFKEHRYYFKGEQKHQIGDSCILEVEGFTDRGFLKLKEVKHMDEAKVEPATASDTGDTANRLAALWEDLPVLEGVEECETLELKTSIVFPPGGDGEPDIDKQLDNILKELTAFMNTKGGQLYIGIHDKTKKIIGIESDLKHLNEGRDEYAGTYSENTDHYELKIRNTIDRKCPSVANSLITVEFPEQGGKTYCKITVRPAKRPIFFRDVQLWIRQGNRLKLLKGDEITFFVTERMTISIRDVLDTEEMNLQAGSTDFEAMKKAMQSLINERHAMPANLPEPKPLGEIDYWIIWYGDSTWKRSRHKSTEPDVYIQVPVYKSAGHSIVAFCYPSGRVSTIQLSVFRRGANLDRLQNNGWSRNEKPMDIFILHATDLLVGYSMDCNGTKCVKLHYIADFPATAAATNQGSPFIPQDWQMEAFYPIGAEHRMNVERLIVPKADRTQNAGTPLNSQSLVMKQAIDYVKKVLTQ